MRIKFEEPVTLEMITDTIQQIMNDYQISLSSVDIDANFRNDEGKLVELSDRKTNKPIDFIVTRKANEVKKKKKVIDNIINFTNRDQRSNQG